MPKFRVTSPDGATYEVNAPDGASEQDAIAYVQQQHASAPKLAPMSADPTQGMSGFDKFAAGAGKAVADLGSGIKQLGASVGNKVGLVSDATVHGIDRDVTDTKARDAALMNTGAGLAGNIAGTVATTLVPAGGVLRGAEALSAARTASLARGFINPATYKAAAASGALQGALQPVADGDSRAANIAIGGAAGVGGNALINGLGRVAQPLQAGATKAAQVLQQAGVPLDAAQLSGSPFLAKVRSALGDNPFTTNAQARQAATQGDAYNNAILKTIGESGSAATSDVMQRADDRIGGVFNDVLSRNKVPITDDVLTRLGAIQQKANDEGQSGASNIINRLMNSIDENGHVPGQMAYNIRKDLVRIGKDPNTGYHARQAGSALMDAINAGLSPEDQAAFQQARGQFRNMALMEGAIDNNGTGQISPAKLANVLGQKTNRDASKYGRGDQELVDLAQAGRQVLGDKTPNSGTTARLAMHFIPGAIAGGASYVNDGDLSKAGSLAGGTYLAPKLVQLLMNNPRAASYLVNGLDPSVKRTLLEAPRDNPTFNALLRALAVSSPASAMR